MHHAPLTYAQSIAVIAVFAVLNLSIGAVALWRLLRNTKRNR
jgi:hypothetical protein